MVFHRWLVIVGLAIPFVIFFPKEGFAQTQDSTSEQVAQEFRKPSGRELDQLFSDLLPYAAGAAVLFGLAMGPSLRVLRHHQGIHFPSRIRRVAIFSGAILTGVCEAIYVSAGAWRHIHPFSVLTHGKSALIPLLFAVLWYITAYGSVRIPRWSGRYALWPLLKGGHS